MLSCYFAGRTFPTLPICEKLYALTKIPSLKPHTAVETIRQIHSERARKIHTPEVDAKISEGLRNNWADNPRSVAYLHTPENKAKAQASVQTPEVRKRMSDSAKAAWANSSERREQYSQRKAQFWVDLKSEVGELRAKFEKLRRGRNRKDKQRKRAAELKQQGLNWTQIKDKMNKEFSETSSAASYRALVRDRRK
jgi:hypothetical protein